MYQFAHDMMDDELAMRSAGGNMMRLLITFLALPHLNDERSQQDEDAIAALSPPSSDEHPLLTSLRTRLPPPRITPPDLLTQVLYPLIKKCLRSKLEDKIRRELVSTLRQLILSFPLAYKHMLLLVDAQHPELDFLENIASIQLHARRRAITRLFARITVRDESNPDVYHAHPSRAVDTQTILHVLMPLLQSIIYDTSGASNNVTSGIDLDQPDGGSNAGHSTTMSKAKAAQKAGAETTLMEEALKLCAKLTAYLPWSAYYHSIRTYLKLVRSKPALERALVRLICGIVREFHFEVEETNAERMERIEAQLRTEREARKAKKLEEKEKRRQERLAAVGGDEAILFEEEDVEEDEPMPDASKIASAEALPESSALSHKIRIILTTSLLPQLHGLLTSRKVKQVRANKAARAGKNMATTYETQNELSSLSGLSGGNTSSTTLELVRVPVAMAMVSLLRQLPSSIFNTEFPRLVTALCQQLQHREQQARDLTRSTLLDILGQLGPFYYHHFLDELSRALTNGFQLHVRGHIVYLSLDLLVNQLRITPGSIDHSIPKLMDLCMNDLLGEPARQKEVAAIRAHGKEARTNHAQDCFHLMARCVGFPQTIHIMVEPFRYKLAHDSSLRLQDLSIISETLKRMALGLHANLSVTSNIPDLLVYVHNYIFGDAHASFQHLLMSNTDSSSPSLTKLKGATSKKKSNYRKLDMTPELSPLEQIRAENRARSEGQISKTSNTIAKRKALEFMLAMQNAASGRSDVERTTQRTKMSKDEIIMVPKAPPTHSQGFDATSVAVGHQSNLMFVFGLQLLYYALKNKRLNVTLSNKSTRSSQQSSSAVTRVVRDNLARLDPFLNLIRNYCLVMGSELGAETNAGTRTKLTKEGEKKTTKHVLVHSSSAVIHAALKCSEHLLQMPALPSLHLYLRDLCNYMFGLIHSKAAPHLLAACYRNLSVVLRMCDWKACGMTIEKQRLLLQFIKAEVLAPTVTSATSIAFRLLQAILSRGAELEELYDFIITVSQLMVTSDVDDVRKQCSAAVYSFLYNYKLGATRMQTHLGFLLNQLHYPHATGRATVLQLLHSIAQHFAQAMIEESFEFLFLPLVVHAANETNAENRKLASELISTLLSRISATKQQQVMRMVYGWWSGEEKENSTKQIEGADEESEEEDAEAEASDNEEKKQPEVSNRKSRKRSLVQTSSDSSSSPSSLQLACLHVIGLYVDLLKSNFTGPLYLERTMDGVMKIVEDAVEAADKARQENDSDEERQSEDGADAVEGDESKNDGTAIVASSWRLLYSALLVLEKLFRHLPGPVLTGHVQRSHPHLFSSLLRCLLYPHSWVRTASCRTIGFILAPLPLDAFVPALARDSLRQTVLASPASLLKLSRALAQQLTSPHLSEALAEQIVKNLVWTTLAAHNMGDAQDMWRDEEEEDEERVERQEDEEEDEAEESKSGIDDDGSMVDVPPASAPSASSSGGLLSLATRARLYPPSSHPLLRWLFTRLSYMCRRDDGIRMRESIFRFFATVCSQLPPDSFAPFLLSVVHPLYRLTANAASARAEESELCSFASSVLQLVQGRVGSRLFLPVYSHVRASVAAQRKARSAKRKANAVVRPEVEARRKQHKNEVKKARQKRKIQQLKDPMQRQKIMQKSPGGEEQPRPNKKFRGGL